MPRYRINTKEMITVRGTIRAGIIACASVACVMLGAPAFAADQGEHEDSHAGVIQHNEIDIDLIDVNNLDIPIGVCENSIGVFGISVPINAPSITDTCSSSVTVG